MLLWPLLCVCVITPKPRPSKSCRVVIKEERPSIVHGVRLLWSLLTLRFHWIKCLVKPYPFIRPISLSLITYHICTYIIYAYLQKIGLGFGSLVSFGYSSYWGNFEKCFFSWTTCIFDPVPFGLWAISFLFGPSVLLFGPIV